MRPTITKIVIVSKKETYLGAIVWSSNDLRPQTTQTLQSFRNGKTFIYKTAPTPSGSIYATSVIEPGADRWTDTIRDEAGRKVMVAVFSMTT